MEFDCPDCGVLLRLKDEFLGRNVKCPKCGTSLLIAEPVPPSLPDEDDPLFSITPGLTPPPVHQELRPSSEQPRVPAYLTSPTGPRAPISNPKYPAAAPPVPIYSTHSSYPNGLGHRTLSSADPSTAGAGERTSGSSAPSTSAQSTTAEVQSPAKTWSMSPGTIATGLLMMLGAMVWVVAGMAAGVTNYYPLVLFAIGIGTVIKGCIGQRERWCPGKK
ncbi:MAG: hypothetical protein Q8M16_20650 [Pirellulaceae bacterium]|nr:hypothetical protein [Pirellulaceae bacterium]